MSNETNYEKVSEADIKANARAAEINSLVKKLIDLCEVEPQASIIASICLPTDDSDSDGLCMAVYAGDSRTQISQINMLMENSADFKSDLMQVLALKVSKQMKQHGTSGNTLADQMLAKLNKTDKIN